MVLTAAINTLNATIGKAIGRIEGVLATSEQAQKASLVLGQSLDGVRASLGADLKQLNGTIGQRLQVGISTLNAGLQGNVQGLLGLLNEQQLLGQNFKATARTFATLEATLGLTRSETVDLAEVLLETKDQFAVSTEKLVNVVDSLSKNMPLLKEAGLQKLPEVAAKLAGQVPALEDDLKKFFGFFTSPSLDTFRKLALLQQPMVREQMAASPADSEKILKNFFSVAAKNIRNLAPDPEGFVGQFSIVESALGDTAQVILSIADSLEKGRKKTEDMNKQMFTAQLKVLRDNFLQPLDAVISGEVFPAILKLGQAVGERFAPIISGLADSVSNVFSNIFKDGNSFQATVDKISKVLIKLGDFFIKVFNVGTSIFQKFYNSLDSISFLVGAFGTVVNWVLSFIDTFMFGIAGGFLGLFTDKQDKISIPKLNTISEVIAENTKKGNDIAEGANDLLQGSLNTLNDINKKTKDETADSFPKPELPERLISSLRVLDQTISQMVDTAVRDPQLDELIELNAVTAGATTSFIEDGFTVPVYTSPFINNNP